MERPLPDGGLLPRIRTASNYFDYTKILGHPGFGATSKAIGIDELPTPHNGSDSKGFHLDPASPVFQVIFLLYLIFWSVFVGAALMAACGVTAHALVPVIPKFSEGA